MAEEWYYFETIGFNRAFITGHNKDTQEFCLELSPEEISVYEEFKFKQEIEMQRFLKEMISAS